MADLAARSAFLKISALAACLMAGALPAAAASPEFLPAKGAVAAPSGAANLCATYDWACATGRSGARLSQGEIDLILEVNRSVNRHTRAIEDVDQYGASEVWTLPSTRGGDCEDFALLKKHELVRRGIEPQRLLIATVLDRNRAPHAVLVLRGDSGDYVLDNLTDEVRTWQDTRYVFLRMQDPSQPALWTNVLMGG